MNTFNLIIVSLILAIGTLQPAYSAEKKDKVTQRKIQQIKQQMEAEKAEMQAKFDQERAALDSKVSDIEKQYVEIKETYDKEKAKNIKLSTEIGKLKKDQLDLTKKLETVQTTLSETQATLEKAKSELATLEAKHLVAMTDLKANDTQRKDLTKALTDRENKLMSCTEKNNQLHAFGIELIKIYDKPSAYMAVLRTEPFTQIKRVELENILQAYRDKLDIEKFDPAVSQPSDSQATLPNQ